MEDKIILGIIIFKPERAPTDVANIGPKNHAKGRLKNSAIKALGIEIAITITNFTEKICLKLSLLNGIAWLFCIIYDFRIHWNW